MGVTNNLKFAYNGKAIWFLALLSGLFSVFAEAAQVTLAWDLSPDANVAGYELSYGTSSNNYPSKVDVQNTSTYVLVGLQEGVTYYFALRGYDSTKAVYSIYSNEVTYTVPTTPTTDTTPPLLSGAGPNGPLPAGTTSVSLVVNTSEVSNCKFDYVSGVNYLGMLYTFSSTNSTAHTTLISGLQDGYSYSVYISCRDTAGNISAVTPVIFTVNSSNTNPLIIGQPNILSNDDNGNANLLLVQKATLTKAATLVSMSFYVTQASGKLRLGLYDASGTGGDPGKKLAETAEITPVLGWNTANVLIPVNLAAADYWLAYLPDDNNLHFRKHGSSGTAKFYSYTYGSMPSAFSSVHTTITDHWSFYATLTDTVITPVNNAPVAQAQSLSVESGKTLTITLAATDADGDALTYSLVTAPAHGTLSGSGASRTYTPSASYIGADSFTFKANDGKVDSAAATVSINVTAPPTTTVTAPSVAIINPADGDLVTAGTKLTITATVTSAAAISGVYFYVNNTLKCSLSASSSYTCSIPLNRKVGKKYEILVKAQNIYGQVGSSPLITVTSQR